VERATGVEPATSSLGTIAGRETTGKRATKKAKFLHFLDQRQPLSDPDFRQFPAECPEISLKEIARRLTAIPLSWTSFVFGPTGCSRTLPIFTRQSFCAATFAAILTETQSGTLSLRSRQLLRRNPPGIRAIGPKTQTRFSRTSRFLFQMTAGCHWRKGS